MSNSHDIAPATARSTADCTDSYPLPAKGRIRLASWDLTSTRKGLPSDLLTAAEAPSVYCLYGLAHGQGAARRHFVGYTGLATTSSQRMHESLAKFSMQPGFELRGLSLLRITGLTGDARDIWLRALEADIVADQCLRRSQRQMQSRAPGAVGALRASGIGDRAMAGTVRRVLAGVREHENQLGIGTAPWPTRGSGSLRDIIAVSALRLADDDGRVGNFHWFLDQLAEVPAVRGRDIARLSDSAGRDVRNRETDLVVPRMHLDDDRVLYVTARALAAVA